MSQIECFEPFSQIFVRGLGMGKSQKIQNDIIDLQRPGKLCLQDFRQVNKSALVLVTLAIKQNRIKIRQKMIIEKNNSVWFSP